MNTHRLKCWPVSFFPIWNDIKTFDIRLDDRGFELGDRLILKEYDPDKKEYTGRVVVAWISFILSEAQFPQFGLKEGYACLSLRGVRQEHGYKT